MQIKTFDITKLFSKGTSTEFLALKGITTTINQGEFIAIIGHTGSGKTTFIEHLNALSKPTTGKVQIGDRVITNSRRKIKKVKEIRKRVGIVFQFAEYQLFEETIEKDIIFGPISMGTSKEKAKELAKKYIKVVGLSEDYLERSPFALSGGQKRRVALAGILAMEPEIMIFDEPTAGLDPKGRDDMYKIFQGLHDLGKTIIVVTHDLDLVLKNSIRALMFREGELVRDESSLDLMYDKKFLIENQLEPPRLSSFVLELESKGLSIGKVRTIEELAKKIKEK